MKTSSSYCSTLLWNCIGPICKHLPPFVTCVRNANDRNEWGQYILLPDSLIYLRSNWRQAICPWEILSSWACVAIREAVVRRCSVEKLLSKKFSKLTGKSCARFSFLINLLAEVCNFILKETRAQGSSCKFCEISKNNFLLQNTSCGCFCNYKKTDITCPLQTYPCTCL